MDSSWKLLHDSLSLEVLEQIDGVRSAGEIAASIEEDSEGVVSVKEVSERLKELYELTLISLE